MELEEAEAVLYTKSEVTVEPNGDIELVAVSATLGINNPLLVDVRSRIALAFGVAMPMPTCALVPAAADNIVISKDSFKYLIFWDLLVVY